MSKPRLCHIMHDGSGQGGGATFARAYFPGYAAVFDTMAIVGADGTLAGDLQQRGVRTITLPMARPADFLTGGPQLWQLLKKEKPDVVVVHGQWGGFFGALAARAAGIKVVLYVTHFPSFYTDWDLGRVLRNRIAEAVTCHFATRIVCLSEAGRYQYLLRRLGAESKFVHIPNGLDPAALTSTVDAGALRAELGPDVQPNDPVVVAVGRLADQKRIDLLLRAWSVVEAGAPRVQLALIGSGPDEQNLRRLAGDLRLARCHFLGPRHEGYRYFRAATAGVICSMYEGQPLALIEAMYVECPMVGTRVDGISETIVDGETGLLVPPADPPALAAAILRLLADPDAARRMARAGRERAETLYRFDEILRRHVELARSELARAGPATG